MDHKKINNIMKSILDQAEKQKNFSNNRIVVDIFWYSI